jgi:hypothetical protein
MKKRFKGTKRATEFLRGATDLLDESGVSYTVERGKHLKLKWTQAGGKKMYVMPVTPSDGRGKKHVRCGVRKMLRQDGL